jgi:hypothetical protein
MSPARIKNLFTCSVVCWTLILVLSGCSSGKTRRQGTQPPPEAVSKTNVPSQQCLTVDKTTGFAETLRDTADVSVAWEPGAFSAKHEVILLNEQNKPIPNQTQVCTTDSTSALISVNLTEITRASLVVRDRESKHAIRMDDLILKPKHISRLGLVLAKEGRSVSGQLTGNMGTDPRGKILELNTAFNVGPDGNWATGPLPAGNWSISITNSEGHTLSWHKVFVDSADVNVGAAELKSKINLVTPLWSGVLNNPYAAFLLSAEEQFTEMRVADNPVFMNSYWTPLRSLISYPVQENGLQGVFVQFRTPERLESDILIKNFRVELAGVLDSADATLTPSVSSMPEIIDFNKPLDISDPLYKKFIHSTVSTVPPANATQQSATIDNDEAPRNWLAVNSPLTVSLPVSPQSCGTHHVFVRFRNADGAQTQSLRREWNIRCWQNDLPPSPLSARFNHGAAAFKFCHISGTDTPVHCGASNAVESDGVFIWGGRNLTQHLADGAMLRKFNSGWRWDMLPANPSLEARIKPRIVAGKNNILVIGGEVADGTPASGFGVFRLSSGTWRPPTSSPLTGSLPPERIHSTVAFVKQLNGPSNVNGAFIVAGGESAFPESGSPTAKEELSHIFEYESTPADNAETEFPSGWTLQATNRGFSRNGRGFNSTGQIFWMVGGLGKVDAESDPDPQLSSEMIAFVSGPNSSNSSLPQLYIYIYASPSERVGSLYGHVFVTERPTNDNTTFSMMDYMETTNVCVFGAQKYTDALPKICEVIEVGGGQPKAYNSFCNRLYDSYLFGPFGRRSVCFRPTATTQTGTLTDGTPVANELKKFMRNFYLPMNGAPAERRLSPDSTASFSGLLNPRLFFWSGVSATGGEFLSDGAIYEFTSNNWFPVTTFEAPQPRNDHTATALKDAGRVFIFGGNTPSGISNQGVFYAIP